MLRSCQICSIWRTQKSPNFGYRRISPHVADISAVECLILNLPPDAAICSRELSHHVKNVKNVGSIDLGIWRIWKGFVSVSCLGMWGRNDRAKGPTVCIIAKSGPIWRESPCGIWGSFSHFYFRGGGVCISVQCCFILVKSGGVGITAFLCIIVVGYFTDVRVGVLCLHRALFFRRDVKLR